MSSVDQIKDAIRNLPPTELAILRAWFAEIDAANWDEQIARDASSGRLDALADDALADLHVGCCTDP
jgi:hypothetical protein